MFKIKKAIIPVGNINIPTFKEIFRIVNSYDLNSDIDIIERCKTFKCFNYYLHKFGIHKDVFICGLCIIFDIDERLILSLIETFNQEIGCTTDISVTENNECIIQIR